MSLNKENTLFTKKCLSNFIKILSLYQKKGKYFYLPNEKTYFLPRNLILQNVTNMAQKTIKTKPSHFIVILNGEQIISENIGDIAPLIMNKKNEINIILSNDSKCIFIDDSNGNKLEIFLQ